MRVVPVGCSYQEQLSLDGKWFFDEEGPFAKTASRFLVAAFAATNAICFLAVFFVCDYVLVCEADVAS